MLWLSTCTELIYQILTLLCYLHPGASTAPPPPEDLWIADTVGTVVKDVVRAVVGAVVEAVVEAVDGAVSGAVIQAVVGAVIGTGVGIGVIVLLVIGAVHICKTRRRKKRRGMYALHFY